MLATTTFQPPATNSKYFMAHPGGPSPPSLASDHPYYYPANPTLDTAPRPPGKQLPLDGPPGTRFWNESWPGIPVGESYAMDVPHLQQRRTAAIEGYLPAALRPTDYTAMRAPKLPRTPDTPPTSKGNSFSSSKDGDPAPPPKHIDDSLRRAGIISIAEGGWGAGISKSTWEELAYPLGKVGPPTSAHWKPDSMAKNCAVCKTKFAWYWRRHHCRRCGEVICSSCCTTSVPLDENAHFHPAGVISKSCSPCFEEWKAVEGVSYRNPDVDPTLIGPAAASATEIDESGHGPYYTWSTF